VDSRHIHAFDVDTNTWLGYYCQDCVTGGRITVFTPVPVPPALWLLGLGIGLMLANRRQSPSR
jgi:hypothetical protein